MNKIFSKLTIFVLIAAMIMFLAVGCTSNKPSDSQNASNDEQKSEQKNEADSKDDKKEEAKSNYPLEFKDALGNTIKFEKKPETVVSLMGSFSDAWLDAGGELAGITDDVKDYREIEVGDKIKEMGSAKEPNLEALLAVKPDFVILSADIKGHVKVGEMLKTNNVPHAYFKVEVFDDYLNMLKIFTDITENHDMYEKNGLQVKERIEKIKAELKFPEKKPSVLLIRAFSSGAKAKTDDVMAGAMLKELGTDNIAEKYPSLLEELSIEAIITEDPDYIFVITMGKSTEKALEGLKNGIQSSPAWSNLSAVKNDKYIVLPKELFHYKPNAEWDKAYDYLAKILDEK